MPQYEDDDSCVAYELIGPSDVGRGHELGYVALYLSSSPSGWKVSGYTANTASGCTPMCPSLWARRERETGVY